MRSFFVVGSLLVGRLVVFLPFSSHGFCVLSNKSRARTSSLLKVEPSKWDNLVDDDEDYDDIPVASDMKYEPRNVKRAHETFNAIRGSGGKEMTNDVYVRAPPSDVFWYAGKVALISDVSLEQCIARQWPMIERHAFNMRPIELYPERGRLEIWTAPGDSELDVAYNRPSLQLVKMSKDGVEGASKVKSTFVGFQGEVYQKGEDGFRTWRTDEGLPARPEINVGGDTRPPTDDEYAQIQREVQGKDTNAVVDEEQEEQKEEGTL
jgi:hypothetical protein